MEEPISKAAEAFVAEQQPVAATLPERRVSFTLKELIAVLGAVLAFGMSLAQLYSMLKKVEGIEGTLTTTTMHLSEIKTEIKYLEKKIENNFKVELEQLRIRIDTLEKR